MLLYLTLPSKATLKLFAHIASAVGVVIATLHTISHLVTPNSFAVSFRDQVSVSVLHVVWDLSQDSSEGLSPSGHQSLSSGGVFLAGNSDWLNLRKEIID